MALEPSSHGYGQCAYHIVLVPRYRHRVFLDARIKKRCEELLRKKALVDLSAILMMYSYGKYGMDPLY